MMQPALTLPEPRSLLNDRDIDPKRIRYSKTVRLLDPNGRVFFYEGGVYRGIYAHRVNFVRQLFESGVVERLSQKGLLVGTRPTAWQLAGFGLVLQHDRLDLCSVPTEWSIATYLGAAIHCLDLLAELYRHDLTLIDCHGGNISLAPGGGTLWHDFGSIVELEQYKLSSLGEFLTHYYFPLLLYRRTGDPALIRRLRMKCTSEELNRLWHPRLFWLVDAFPNIPGGANVEKALRKRMAADRSQKLHPLGRLRALGRYWAKEFSTHSASRLYELLMQLRSDLQRIRIRNPETAWGNYHRTEAIETPAERRDNRSRAIDRLLEEAGGDRVLDLGANQGMFSHLAYRHCDAVIAADYDETAVAKHALLLRGMSDRRRVYPLVLDVTQLTADAAERLRSPTVLALALTHHLRLGQQYPFWFIVQQLSLLTEKRLITEFMPHGLGGVTGPSPNPLPADYTLEAFLNALRQEFHRVQVVEYERQPQSSPRTLIVCDKYAVRE